MLPEEVVGRYKRYKRGTRKLVCWLVKAVGECGDLAAIINTLPAAPSPPSGLSKGKCGKNTTSEKKNKAEKSSALRPAEVEVKPRELVKLAEAVAHAEPPAAVPEYILTIAEDVIRGREECHGWYSGQASENRADVEDRNKTHRHFINVLKEVLDLLQHAHSRRLHAPGQLNARPETPNPSGQGKRPHNSKRKPLNTLFECLSVEDPGENALGDEPPALTLKTNAGSAQVKVKLEEQNDDHAFQTWCFLQDLADTRKSIKKIWQEYGHGDTSFLNASLVTEAAFGLLRRADEDIVAVIPIHSTDWQSLISYLGLSYTFSDGTVSMHSNADDTAQERHLPESNTDLAELLCPAAYLCLDDFRSGMQAFCQHCETKAYESQLSKLDIESGRHGMPIMKALLEKIISDCCGDGHLPANSNIIIDEFLQGLSTIHRTSTIRMWIVVACQIYLDLHELLGRRPFEVMDAVRMDTTEFDDLTEQIIDYATRSKHPINDVGESLLMLDIGVETAHEIKNGCPWLMNQYNKTIASKDPGKKQIEKIVSQNPFPAKAGSALSSHRLYLYRQACDFMMHGSFVLMAAHLHRAMCAMGILQAADWPDMDFVLSSFGSSQPLVSERDGEYDATVAASHLLLDLGMSPRVFATDFQPQPGRSAQQRLPRRMSISSPLLNAFLGDGLSNWIKYGIEYAQINSLEVALRALTEVESQDEGSDTSEQKPTQAQRKNRFTPAELLDTLTRKLRDDETTINFDYIPFTLCCARLIQVIGLVFNGSTPAQNASSAEGYPVLIVRLLQMPAEAESMTKVANLMQAHIRKNGKKHLQKAEARSRRW